MKPSTLPVAVQSQRERRRGYDRQERRPCGRQHAFAQEFHRIESAEERLVSGVFHIQLHFNGLAGGKLVHDAGDGAGNPRTH
jgi:hypothetical protein